MLGLKELSSAIVEQILDVKDLHRAYLTLKRDFNRKEVKELLERKEGLLLDFVNVLMEVRKSGRKAVRVVYKDFKGLVVIDNKDDDVDLQSLLSPGYKIQQ